MNFFKMLGALFGTMYELFRAAHVASMAVGNTSKIYYADSQAKYEAELEKRGLKESDIEDKIQARIRELSED